VPTLLRATAIATMATAVIGTSRSALGRELAGVVRRVRASEVLRRWNVTAVADRRPVPERRRAMMRCTPTVAIRNTVS
jgi:hypothetical protein